MVPCNQAFNILCCGDQLYESTTYYLGPHVSDDWRFSLRPSGLPRTTRVWWLTFQAPSTRPSSDHTCTMTDVFRLHPSSGHTCPLTDVSGSASPDFLGPHAYDDWCFRLRLPGLHRVTRVRWLMFQAPPTRTSSASSSPLRWRPSSPSAWSTRCDSTRSSTASIWSSSSSSSSQDWRTPTSPTGRHSHPTACPG